MTARRMRTVFCAAVLAALAGCSSAPDEDAAGEAGASQGPLRGQLVEPPYPFLVAQVKPGEPANTGYFCAATRIAPEWLLTAATCAYRKTPEDLRVVVGNPDLQFRPVPVRVDRLIVHESFEPLTYANDVALLHIDPEDENWVGEVRDNLDDPETVQLPPPGLEVPEGTWVTVPGWGQIPADKGPWQGVLEDDVRSVVMPVVRQRTCIDAMSDAPAPVNNGHICAGAGGGPADACLGFSGSPLLVPAADEDDPPVQIGFISWGIGCGEPNRYAVATRISYYEPWIRAKMAGR